MSILQVFNDIIAVFQHSESAPEPYELPAAHLKTGKQLLQIHSESQVPTSYGNWTRTEVKHSSLFQEIRQLSPRKRALWVLQLIPTLKVIRRMLTAPASRHHDHPLKQMNDIGNSILSSLLRSNLPFEEAELIELIRSFRSKSDHYVLHFTKWPVSQSIRQIKTHAKKKGLSSPLHLFLTDMLTWPELENGAHSYGLSIHQLSDRIEHILYQGKYSAAKVSPVHLSEEDAFGTAVNAQLANIELPVRDDWYRLLRHIGRANGGTPGIKWMKSTNTLIEAIGRDAYCEQVGDWMESISDLPTRTQPHTTTYQGDYNHTYTEHQFMDRKNIPYAKGLVWSFCEFSDLQFVETISRVTERAFRKIPGVGASSQALGNAGLYCLAHMPTLHGLANLLRLKQQIRPSKTRKLIQRYLDEASRDREVSLQEIEMLGIPDFELTAGKKEVLFGDYRLHIQIEKIGKVSSIWIKPDGKSQKSVPAAIKNEEDLAKKLKQVKSEIRQIQKQTTTQRDLIDRYFIEDISWKYEDFRDQFIHHGLIQGIASKLIWQVETETGTAEAMLVDGNWEAVTGETLTAPRPGSQVRLWHPVESPPSIVLAWRDRLEALAIQQPLKQAYREVYLLTDAEVNTGTYSNRMAAHIIKQFQFNSLASLRGWEFGLIGAWDHGQDGIARKTLSTYGIEAQYWTQELMDENAISDSGIYLYLTTDQVRFVQNGEAMNLAAVPVRVFSEVMRDVDLFVGVASVGNDPVWRDSGGTQQHRDYWTSYSFGNLSEVAKTRKAMLERLIPRLGIREVAHIEGKFLHIKGHFTTYKIHIGSTNILMKPNDQYLCIVPSRNKTVNTGKVLIPFEGDRGLSIILSKAFLLADDSAITDPTIISQLPKK